MVEAAGIIDRRFGNVRPRRAPSKAMSNHSINQPSQQTTLTRRCFVSMLSNIAVEHVYGTCHAGRLPLAVALHHFLFSQATPVLSTASPHRCRSTEQPPLAYTGTSREPMTDCFKKSCILAVGEQWHSRAYRQLFHTMMSSLQRPPTHPSSQRRVLET